MLVAEISGMVETRNVQQFRRKETTLKNAFESVLMKWMKLEPIITELSKSERNIPIQYTNTYIWNLERW